MHDRDSLNVVSAWVEAANAQDAERLLDLSDSNIELAGPRGSGFGHQLLRDWVARAGLTLATQRMFVRDDTVVLEQRGVWRSMQTEEVAGERTLASLFQVDGRRVVKFARFDDLAAARAAAGLAFSDEAPRANEI